MMKKVLVLTLALMMMFVFAACGQEEEPDPGTVGMPNPITGYDTLDEINEAAGTSLQIPADWEVSDEMFSTVDCTDYLIAQYDFSYGDFDSWCFRSAINSSTDISGVYIDGNEAFAAGGADGVAVNSDADCKVARWFTGDEQFTIYVADGGAMSDEDFLAAANRLYDLTASAEGTEETAAYYESLAGEWSDSTSGRAVLNVEANGSDSMTFTVSWGNSAFETYQWTMTVALADDGLLHYNDCRESIITLNQDEEESVEVIAENGEGYFSYTDDALLWNGAADESCVDCRFVK